VVLLQRQGWHLTHNFFLRPYRLWSEYRADLRKYNRGGIVAEVEQSEALAASGSVYYPELVICLCAAVGTDTTVVSEALASELLAVGYKPVPVRLSALMGQIPGLEYLTEIRAEDDRIRESMTAGNDVRKIIGHADAVARLALAEIHHCRAGLNESDDVTVPAERH
jgi:hypothetical protein